jgi:hypothetical protein
MSTNEQLQARREQALKLLKRDKLAKGVAEQMKVTVRSAHRWQQ